MREVKSSFWIKYEAALVCAAETCVPRALTRSLYGALEQNINTEVLSQALAPLSFEQRATIQTELRRLGVKVSTRIPPRSCVRIRPNPEANHLTYPDSVLPGSNH